VTDFQPIGLRLVDGLALDEPLRAALRPDEVLVDERGRARRLPRFFFEVGSREKAHEVELAPGFSLHELMRTDVREAAVLRGYPRYVPCATAVLAAHLAAFRAHVGTYVHVAANGGYRSPGHTLTRAASTHCWGTAANVFRIGDDRLDTQEAIAKYAALVREALPAAWVRPYGHAAGFADDHLHLDLGYTVTVPHAAPGEEAARGGEDPRRGEDDGPAPHPEAGR
jgi:hypothetical protein